MPDTETKLARQSLTIRGALASITAGLGLVGVALVQAIEPLEAAGIAPPGSGEAAAGLRDSLGALLAATDALIVAGLGVASAVGGVLAVVGRFRASQPIARRGDSQ